MYFSVDRVCAPLLADNRLPRASHAQPIHNRARFVLHSFSSLSPLIGRIS
jgi:hypothetical protein